MSHTQYLAARQRLQRSELAVPGTNPGLFEKAANSAADYIFLDLEDAVAPGIKYRRAKMSSKHSTISTGALRAKPFRCASTVSIRITCIATWSTWWSRPVIGSIRF